MNFIFILHNSGRVPTQRGRHLALADLIQGRWILHGYCFDWPDSHGLLQNMSLLRATNPNRTCCHIPHTLFCVARMNILNDDRSEDSCAH